MVGEILFEDKDLAELSYKEVADLKGRDISMIFQEPMTSVNPVLTIGHQVGGDPLRIHSSLSPEEITKRLVDFRSGRNSRTAFQAEVLPSPIVGRDETKGHDRHGHDMWTPASNRRLANGGFRCDHTNSDIGFDARTL